MNLDTINAPNGVTLKRFVITKRDAIHLARELLELAEGNGINAQGRESTHWVVELRLHGEETHFCFAL